MNGYNSDRLKLGFQLNACSQIHICLIWTLFNIIAIAFVQVTMQKELNVLVLTEKIISRAFIQQVCIDVV